MLLPEDQQLGQQLGPQCVPTVFLAQWIEHQPSKLRVIGSNPIGNTPTQTPLLPQGERLELLVTN